MTKNVILLNVYVLFLMVFCSLVASILFFGSTSLAFNDSDVTDWFDNKADTSLYSQYETMIDDFYSYYQDHQSYGSCQLITDGTQTLYLFCADNFSCELGSNSKFYVAGSGRKWSVTTDGSYNHSDFSSLQQVTGVSNGNFEQYSSYSDIGVNTVDYDNPIYAVNIPVPVLDVTYVPAISMLGGLPQSNNVFTEINVEDNAAFKVQLAVKITVADMVQIGLTDGTTTYKYLDWTEGTLSDIYSLQDLQDAEDIYISNSDLSSVWNNLYNSLYDDPDFPIFSSSVPFWNSNPNAQKYLDAKSYYRNNMARQMPMFGTRLEVFARYFAIDDNKVYVGAWRHWNSAEPLNTEKITDKYQDQQPFPGTENTNTNVDYDTSDDTYTTIGTQTGVYQDPYTQVVINQNVPNYPDYPTAVSYNHDNILVQMIQTANQLPNFFGQFGNFLTSAFSFIDPSVWAVIGFGFMCSIVVMIIKVL